MSAQSAIFNPSQTTSAASGDGFSVPRMTTAGRLAINFTSIDEGMMVYDTDINSLFTWNGAAWSAVGGSAAGIEGSVQYKEGSATSGDSVLVWEKAPTNRLKVGTVEIWTGAAATNFNTAVGQGTLSFTTGGLGGNTAVGAYAGDGISTASYCTAIGIGAMNGGLPIHDGVNNTAIGAYSMGQSAQISGTDNVAVGYSSHIFLGSGSRNVGVGSEANWATTGGNAMVGVGYQANRSNTTGYNNVAVGSEALRQNVSGAENVAVGTGAARNITGDYNTAIGSNALYSATTGGVNTAVGFSAMNSNVSGNYNAAFGAASGLVISTGSHNTMVGYSAGLTTTSGSENIIIGSNAAASTASVSNELVIGSSARWVATNGNATTLFTTATTGAVTLGQARGYIRINLNGTLYKIPVYGN